MKENTLIKIKERYFRNGKVVHHADCNIYRTKYPHCTCGLIHDLLVVDFPQLVYKNFANDHCMAEGMFETQEEYKKESTEIKKHIKAASKLVEQVFGKYEPRKPSKEDIEIVKEIFGDVAK